MPSSPWPSRSAPRRSVELRSRFSTVRHERAQAMRDRMLAAADDFTTGLQQALGGLVTDRASVLPDLALHDHGGRRRTREGEVGSPNPGGAGTTWRCRTESPSSGGRSSAARPRSALLRAEAISTPCITSWPITSGSRTNGSARSGATEAAACAASALDLKCTSTSSVDGLQLPLRRRLS
jgi:hypothetical protein